MPSTRNVNAFSNTVMEMENLYGSFPDDAFGIASVYLAILGVRSNLLCV